MSQASTRPLRARQPAEKQQRREDILRAAEGLWQASSYYDVSMNQIAQEAALAKGTLYLYFSTKEELFLELLHLHLLEWFETLKAQLERDQPRTADECASTLLAASSSQLRIRRLLILLSTILAPAVGQEKITEFRRSLLRQAFPVLELMPFTPGVNVRILMHLYALSTGWHLAAEKEQLASHTTTGTGSTSTANAATKLPAEYERPSFQPEFELAFRSVVRAVVASA